MRGGEKGLGGRIRRHRVWLMSCGECMHWEGGEGPVDVNTEIEATSPPTNTYWASTLPMRRVQEVKSPSLEKITYPKSVGVPPPQAFAGQNHYASPQPAMPAKANLDIKPPVLGSYPALFTLSQTFDSGV